jgi:hypothetical protein
VDAIERQLQIFQHGTSKASLVRPATKSDGIISLQKEQFKEYAAFFDLKKDTLKLKKFVPASGAASRMFKFLSEFLNEFDLENETINAYINRKGAANLTVFLTGLEKFPFYDAVDAKLRAQNYDFDSWERDRKNYEFIRVLLDPSILTFAANPKESCLSTNTQCTLPHQSRSISTRAPFMRVPRRVAPALYDFRNPSIAIRKDH